MARTFPAIRFERYVDDAVVHCVSKAQAIMVAQAIGDRMVEVGLRLHPDKTKDRVLQGRQPTQGA
jgi:RNA-directed DNA polymerase